MHCCTFETLPFPVQVIFQGWESHDLALQHFVIAAKLGDRDSLDEVKDMFMDGLQDPISLFLFSHTNNTLL